MKSQTFFSVIIVAMMIQSCATKPSENLHWYATCGDPVCRDDGYREKPGVPLCTDTQQVGNSCNDPSLKCDPKNSCNSIYVCTDKDPTTQPGGCPISRKNAKKEIQYLSDDDYQFYYDQLLRIRLANYRYNWDDRDTPQHLGFIIDDVANPHQCPAIASGGQVVDVYGYTSMAVAAIKAQSKRIETLEDEIKKLKEQLKALR